MISRKSIQFHSGRKKETLPCAGIAKAIKFSLEPLQQPSKGGGGGGGSGGGRQSEKMRSTLFILNPATLALYLTLASYSWAKKTRNFIRDELLL